MPFFNASAPPFGTESPKKATLCGPPDTLMNRTVVPVLIVSLLGSNAAWVVPLPVIFTSTTAPAGSELGAAGVAAGAGVAAWAWEAAGFFLPPQATAVNV